LKKNKISCKSYNFDDYGLHLMTTPNLKSQLEYYMKSIEISYGVIYMTPKDENML